MRVLTSVSLVAFGVSFALAAQGSELTFELASDPTTWTAFSETCPDTVRGNPSTSRCGRFPPGPAQLVYSQGEEDEASNWVRTLDVADFIQGGTSISMSGFSLVVENDELLGPAAGPADIDGRFPDPFTVTQGVGGMVAYELLNAGSGNALLQQTLNQQWLTICFLENGGNAKCDEFAMFDAAGADDYYYGVDGGDDVILDRSSDFAESFDLSDILPTDGVVSAGDSFSFRFWETVQSNLTSQGIVAGPDAYYDTLTFTAIAREIPVPAPLALMLPFGTFVAARVVQRSRR